MQLFLFPITERERIKKPEKALKKLDLVCSDIQNGIVKKRGWNAFSTLLGKTQNIAYPKMERKGKSSFRTDETCIGCGLCVKSCPAHNLALVNGRVIQKNNCTLCYRCVLNRAALCICIKNPKGNIKESDADKNLLLIDCRILEGTVNRKRLLFDVFGSKIEKS